MSDVQDLTRPELVCPAGTPAALRTAVDAGADAVYCGLQNETNARNFPGLNFTVAEVEQSLAYAHARNAKVLLAVNTFPPAGKFQMWKDAIDGAARLGVDAVIVADMGVADYAARSYPDLRLHLSVQAGASSPEAIRFYCEQFGVKRVVLPRMLTVAEIAELHSQIPCEIEAFIFGNIGMMAEGRCYLSNYVTGESTNMDGVCSPAADVHYEEDAARNLTTRLGDYVIDCFRRRRERRLSDHLQGPLSVRRAGRRLLRLRGAGQPQSVGAAARPDAGRRHRAQDRGPPAQPRLRQVGGRRLPQGGRRHHGGPRRRLRQPVGAHRRPPRDRRRLPQQAMEMSVQAKSELTLGPVLFNWQPETWRDFYFRIADEAPVETVYLGEVVCFKRAPLFDDYRDAVAARLKMAGKTVVRSTLAEVMSKQERQMIDDVCAGEDMVEANDGSALLRLRGRPHHAGPFINVYNERTLAVLAGNGVRNVCLPPEMPADRHPRAGTGSGQARSHDRSSGVRPRRPRPLRPLLSRARAWAHERQLPVRLQ